MQTCIWQCELKQQVKLLQPVYYGIFRPKMYSIILTLLDNTARQNVKMQFKYSVHFYYFLIWKYTNK